MRLQQLAFELQVSRFLLAASLEFRHIHLGVSKNGRVPFWGPSMRDPVFWFQIRCP